eukprot:TRINITY_DN617_c2_g1_i1.p2 TRINITY_DN617_c2_g1~~TRINITY_DN617_c2_g1_i1.p2  ORF type:complete len:413 (-),score=23.85 TRINITY_DN617_c2_g1_i1:4717-5955(-)
MKALIIGILFIFLGGTVFSQEVEEYPSKAEKEYYKKYRHKKFKPCSEKHVQKAVYSEYALKKVDSKNPFTDVWARSELQDCLYSLEQEWIEDFLNEKSTLESEHRYAKAKDSIKVLHDWEKINSGSKCTILRQDSTAGMSVILYSDYALQEGHKAGYWLSVYDHKTKERKEYYTGMTANHFCYIKPKSEVELFKNDSILQFEIALVREIKEEMLPTSPPEFALVEDNLIMEYGMSKLMQDSDGDGLTDILETKLWTNPFSKDSDGDGIEDSIDNNPRHESKSNKYTNLYLQLLEGVRDSIIPFDRRVCKTVMEEEQNISDKNAIMIITENEAISQIPNAYTRFIILTPKEYKKYIEKNHSPLKKTSISPLFSIDGMPNHYKISVDYHAYGDDYLVIEKDGYWIVRNIGGYII